MAVMPALLISSLARGGYRRTMEIKDAVRKAIAFATESLGPARTADIRLEEIESSGVEGRPAWLITLSNSGNPSGSSAV